jgi:hypothetical protein
VPSVVAAGAEGFIGAAVGQMRSTGDAFTTFMTSSDGIAWSAISDNWAGLILDMAIAPDGRVVAVGAIDNVWPGDGRAMDAIVWTSIDGATWTRPEIVTPHARMSSITNHDGRFFAIATGDGLTDEGPRVDTIWSSTDGVSWTPAAIPLTTLAREETLHRIFAAAGGVIAVGVRDVGGISNASAWISLDGGLSWGRVPADAFSGVNNEIASLIPTRDSLLAVGQRWDPATNHPLPQVWVAQR